MKTPEGKVKDQIKAWLKKRGTYFFMPVQTGMGTAALDFACCYRGLFVAVETKSATGKMTKRQEHIKTLIEDAGGIVIIARSVWDVQIAFENLDQRIDCIPRPVGW